jgi:hypothetical protein
MALRSAPDFAGAILTLALGIGANLAVSRQWKLCCCARSPRAHQSGWCEGHEADAMSFRVPGAEVLAASSARVASGGR